METTEVPAPRPEMVVDRRDQNGEDHDQGQHPREDDQYCADVGTNHHGNTITVMPGLLWSRPSAPDGVKLVPPAVLVDLKWLGAHLKSLLIEDVFCSMQVMNINSKRKSFSVTGIIR